MADNEIRQMTNILDPTTGRAYAVSVSSTEEHYKELGISSLAEIPAIVSAASTLEPRRTLPKLDELLGGVHERKEFADYEAPANYPFFLLRDGLVSDQEVEAEMQKVRLYQRQAIAGATAPAHVEERLAEWTVRSKAIGAPALAVIGQTERPLDRRTRRVAWIRIRNVLQAGQLRRLAKVAKTFRQTELTQPLSVLSLQDGPSKDAFIALVPSDPSSKDRFARNVQDSILGDGAVLLQLLEVGVQKFFKEQAYTVTRRAQFLHE